MKKLRFLTTIIAGLWCCVTVNAYEYTKVYDFYKNNIYYKITSASTVKVTYNYYNDNDESDYYGEYYTSYGNNIPSTVEYNGITYTVTAIGDYAFYTSNITSITIPNTVVSIGERAFTYCRSLTSITIPENVINIGWQAFYGCEKLQSLTISAQTAPKIGYQAFQNIPKSCVLDYPIEGFDSYSSWQSYFTFNKFRVDGIYYKVINGDVEVIDDNEGYVPNTDLYVGDIVIPESVSFSGKKYTVSFISMTAFWNSTKMTSITIPSTIKRIPNEAFRGCTGLISAVISEGVEEIGGSAFSGTALTSVTIPSSVKTIAAYAFFACDKLEELVIFEGVEIIYSQAFNNCRSLKNVVIPESVTTLSDGVFNNCPLEDITFYRNFYNAGSISSQKKHLVLNDVSAIDFSYDWFHTYSDVTYNRTLTTGKYETIMLPFIPDEESLENFAFFALTSDNGEYLFFDEVEEPKANTPYLCTLREGKETTKITGGKTTISNVTTETNIDGWMMVGTFSNRTIATENRSDCYFYDYIPEDNQLHRATKELHTKPYRAYFISDNNQPTQIAVRTSCGDITIIDATEVEGLTPAVYYDLSGRRIDNPQKGIYIVNGKKVIL